MTLNGTVNKTGLLLLLSVITATFAWSQIQFTAAGAGRRRAPTCWGGAIGGLVLALITTFKKAWSPVTAPLYALVEGFFLGAISAMYNHLYEGIVMQAVVLTFGTLFALLFAYRSGLIRATENFKLGVVAATGGIALLYLVSMVLGIFGINIPYIHESRPDRHRLQPVRGGDRGAEPGAGLRLHRERRRAGRAEVHGVVRRVRPDGHAGVAVPRVPAPAVEAAVARLIRRADKRNEKGRQWRPFS